MAKIIEAPNSLKDLEGFFTPYSIFLAGSIENGKAIDWQEKLSQSLLRFENLIILNPRRKNWNPDLSGNLLRDQIIWEQNALKRASLVVFYFDPETKSPISLLELGQMLGSRKKVVVFCPPHFYRYMNVQVTCQEYGVHVHPDYNTFLSDIISYIARNSF